MSKRTYIVSTAAMIVLTLGSSVAARTQHIMTQPVIRSLSLFETDRDRDGLLGPVRRIKTETVRLINKGDKSVEEKRQVLETAAYDVKGSKIENAYFPMSGASALTGNENYKYDEKGNISEMTLFKADGSLSGKEVYSYEYDFVGNWIKMTTSVAVIEGGKINFEPTEVTYRTISYYLDDALAKMIQPPSPPASAPVSMPSTTTATTSTTGNAHGPTAIKSDKTDSTLPPRADISLQSKTAAGVPSGSVLAPGSNPNAPTGPTVLVDNEPPAQAAPKPLLKPISGGVLNGKAVDLPSPIYPEIARRMRATGLVAVEVLIDLNGKVIAAKAVSGNTVLKQAAVQAALRARFSPTTLSGQPVKVSGVINYNFALAK